MPKDSCGSAFAGPFGTLQAVFKHKKAFTTNRAMGFFALPNILIFQISAAVGLAPHRYYVHRRTIRVSDRPALSSRHRQPRELREAAGLLPYLSDHRFRHFGPCFFLERGTRPIAATAGCSSISGCSDSLIARYFRLCYSRPSSAPSMAGPLTGTSSNGRPRCLSRLRRLRRGPRALTPTRPSASAVPRRPCQ